METFTDFTLTRTPCDDLGAHMGADYFEDAPRAGFLYRGDAYIEREPGGRFFLILHRDSWVSHDLQELEARLYAWCLTEMPEELGLPGDVARFVTELQRAIGLEKFAKAMLENMTEPNPSACHFHDYCDPNAILVDGMGLDIDAADDLYHKARPILRGRRD